MVASSELVAACESELAASGYRILTTIKVEEKDGELVLRGRVRSFFMKQMAQVIIKPVCGNTPIANLLEVVPVSLAEEISKYSRTQR
jgi:osmotically-inducible protein OsmY